MMKRSKFSFCILILDLHVLMIFVCREKYAKLLQRIVSNLQQSVYWKTIQYGQWNNNTNPHLYSPSTNNSKTATALLTAPSFKSTSASSKEVLENVDVIIEQFLKQYEIMQHSKGDRLPGGILKTPTRSTSVFERDRDPFSTPARGGAGDFFPDISPIRGAGSGGKEVISTIKKEPTHSPGNAAKEAEILKEVSLSSLPLA